VIFADANVLYSVLVQTKFTKFAQDIILMKSDLATSSTVLGELVFISLLIASTCFSMGSLKSPLLMATI